MANKKKYYGLDDVGFVGVAKERSEAEVRQDAKRTSDYIKNYRSLSENRAANEAQPKRSSSTGRALAAGSSKKKSAVKTK
ncbi:MAG TPA: hypothetical protein VMR70_13545 [Flavisolibacter sp.]|nr:hypothetical protein [Flavisolibacter sp.]